MTQPRHRIRPSWEYREAQQAAFELEALLSAHDIAIAPGSAMEGHILNVMTLVYNKEDRATPEDDVRDKYRTLIGIHEISSAILAVKDSPSFNSLLPHLRLLSGGSTLQNTPSHGTDQVTNKLFELLVGSWLLQCGTDVSLDHPTSSTGDNPDVLGSLCGRRWGIACKVIHGLSPEGFIGHLRKGIDQIERSSAEVGVVLFNLKNVLPHDRIWPLGEVVDAPGEFATGCWLDPTAPFAILVESLDELGERLVSYLPPDYLNTVFAGKKSIPGFLLWAHAASGILVNGRPAPSSVRALNFRNLVAVEPDIENALNCLTWASFAGSPSRGPKPSC